MVPGSIPGGVTGFFSDIFLLTIPWPWSRLSPSENEYQEHFLGVRAAGAWGWQPHHLHVLNVRKSGSLNFLEPPLGLLQDSFTFYVSCQLNYSFDTQNLPCICYCYYVTSLLLSGEEWTWRVTLCTKWITVTVIFQAWNLYIHLTE